MDIKEFIFVFFCMLLIAIFAYLINQFILKNNLIDNIKQMIQKHKIYHKNYAVQKKKEIKKYEKALNELKKELNLNDKISNEEIENNLIEQLNLSINENNDYSHYQNDKNRFILIFILRYKIEKHYKKISERKKNQNILYELIINKKYGCLFLNLKKHFDKEFSLENNYKLEKVKTDNYINDLIRRTFESNVNRVIVDKHLKNDNLYIKKEDFNLDYLTTNNIKNDLILETKKIIEINKYNIKPDDLISRINNYNVSDLKNRFLINYIKNNNILLKDEYEKILHDEALNILNIKTLSKEEAYNLLTSQGYIIR